ncbi:hypothetical protein CBR_g37793 [Chara braunii]|uniref:Uncharacterized protein n=1 Tax=Chara braunii TaxID=69332 RepID=A0A388LNY0_CHABU|nr:hypothetical protein CBR_g37793 [Chara braunii]|eukprot:GBG83922.1 hypothetical protein CBR_g37793 [Chara braunii]
MTPIKALLLVIIASSFCVATRGTPLANGVKYGNKFFCFFGFTQCPSGIEQCIKPERECDGVEDCPDSSDEGTRCASFDCPSAGRYDCPSGANFCMNMTDANGSQRYPYRDAYKYYLCDGVKDCAGGSDEDPGFCATYDCVANVSHRALTLPVYFESGPPRVRCSGPDSEKNGGCALELCDGVAECAGGSDESDKLCQQRGCARSSGSTSLFQCRSGRCIDWNLMCDDNPDCPHGDDEGSWCATAECPNPYKRVKCPGDHNQTCIPKGRMCDGVRDCPAGTDEAGCDLFECYYDHCPSGVCSSQPMGLCNGIRECRDGSDEDPDFCRTYNCSADMRKCKDGRQCMWEWAWCDGQQHCLDGSNEDPDSCASQESCAGISRVRCPGQARTCMFFNNACDGAEQCLDGSDENATFCASKEAERMMEATLRIRCKNGTGTEIISGSYCDGKKDCADGSDENESFCKSYTCLPGRVKCYGTWCVLGGRCDGVRNCPDGSDEAGCGTVSAPLPPSAPPAIP